MNLEVADIPERLRAALQESGIEFEILAPGVPMPTVPSAAAAIGVPVEQILKTLLFAGAEGGYVIAIANGTGRVDRTLLAQVSGLSKPRPANPADVLRLTGYPAGGVAPIGLRGDLPVIVDVGVAGLLVAFGGAGREDLLVRIAPADVIRLNGASVAAIVGDR